MPTKDTFQIAAAWSPSATSVVFQGDCLELLRSIPDGSIQLVATSPPYNIGKSYEKRSPIERYVEWQAEVIRECVRVLGNAGSICWQVGNFVEDGCIVPIDTMLHPVFAGLGLRMRNRIVWHFEHGLHCSRRFSGRYETIAWYTKSDEFVFHLDPVRVPQKYPGKKHFKGPRAGTYSCNPKGKNPGDVWAIPNVKSNHVEKTGHPCQFPVELIERLVLSMSNEGDWVLDPFAGVGTTMVAAARHDRRGAGAEIVPEYARIARERVAKAMAGTLPVRARNTPVFDPANAGRALRMAPWLAEREAKPPEDTAPGEQLRVFDNAPPTYGGGS